MKNLKNKLSYKIILSLAIVILISNFIMPSSTYAVSDGLFGALFTPIQSFTVALGDAIMLLLQKSFVGDEGVVKKDSEGIYIPNYLMSPELIFSNAIAAFDINFYNTSKTVNTYETKVNETILDMNEIDDSFADIHNSIFAILNSTGCTEPSDSAYKNYLDRWTYPNLISKSVGNYNDCQTNIYWKVTENGSETIYHLTKDWNDPGNKVWYRITKEHMIAVSKESSKDVLQSTIAYWYVALRNIAIVGLLSVLVYIGIRIVISSSAPDKSKYKEMLKDWVVAMCLLFTMHYLMSFMINITTGITQSLTGNTSATRQQYTETQTGKKYTGDKFMGAIRLKLQYATAEGDLTRRMAFTIIFFVLVIYTIVFAVIYLKRVVYIAFLTMISPLVALTYPLDKIRDGKAQAFNMWMKEYTFNVLIQPVHLILYYVLVGTTIDLAINESPFFALIAIGFIMPAEKLIKQFFGLDKAGTGSALGGALGGAMVMNLINSAKKNFGSTKKNAPGSGKGQGQENSGGNKPIRTADSGNNIGSLIGQIPGDGANVGIPEMEGTGNMEGMGNTPLFDEGEDDRALYGDDYIGDADGFGDLGDLGELDDDSIRMDDLDGLDDELGELEGIGAPATTTSSEETHRLRAAMTLLGRYTAKGGIKLAGMAAKGTAAATFGTIGVAAGLASDDYRHVFTYGMGAAAAGYAMAGSVGNAAMRLPSSVYRTATNIRNEYEQGAYSPAELKRIQNERADAAFMKDKEAIQLYKSKFGNSYESAMEDARKYRSYGVTDNQTIIKAMNLKTQGLGDRASSSRILIAKTAPSLGRKDIDTFGKRLSARGKGSSANIITQGVREFNDFE